MPPPPFPPSRAPSNQSTKVHFELRNDDTVAHLQPGTSRREISRSESCVKPVEVRRELVGPSGNLAKVPAGPAGREVRSRQDVAGCEGLSADIGGTTGQRPAMRRGYRAGVKTRACRAWKETR